MMEAIYVSSMSTMANNFLQNCLIKNPNMRPPAISLLNHPFISNNYMQQNSPKLIINKQNYLIQTTNHRIQVTS
jgi:serine/threonine protein kinase